MKDVAVLAKVHRMFFTGITYAYGKMQLHLVELATFLVRNSN